MKLIKFLSRTGISTRSQTKKYLKGGYIILNQDTTIYDENHILTQGDILTVVDIEVKVQFEVGVALHKPAGYVCSRKSEGGYASIFDLLEDCIYKDTLYIAGRLDADTEGLVYLHSDGDMIHKITSPKHNKEKEYFVQIARPITDEDISKLQNGVYIGPDLYPDLTKTGGYTTLAAKVSKVSDDNIGNQIHITITEGKYHQVKRMLEVIGNKVMYLKRLRIGDIKLGNLAIGKREYQNRPK